MPIVTTRPRLAITSPPSVRVGDLSYDPNTSVIPAAGESPSWWPLAALASVGVIVLIFVYGHKTGWT